MTLEAHLLWALLVAVYGTVSRARETLLGLVLCLAFILCSLPSPTETNVTNVDTRRVNVWSVPYLLSKHVPQSQVATLAFGEACFPLSIVP
jgi:hypothetical protein